jgi:hypothetical protein
MAGAELDAARVRGRATEEQRMGAAEEHRNGEEWREEGEIGGGESVWWTAGGYGRG